MGVSVGGCVGVLHGTTRRGIEAVGDTGGVGHGVVSALFGFGDYGIAQGISETIVAGIALGCGGDGCVVFGIGGVCRAIAVVVVGYGVCQKCFGDRANPVGGHIFQCVGAHSVGCFTGQWQGGAHGQIARVGVAVVCACVVVGVGCGGFVGCGMGMDGQNRV